MNNDPVIAATLQTLSQFNPKSVFLYGSRSRKDFTPDSDYEIGVIFDDDKYVQRSDIHAAISSPKVKAYPFKWGELLSGNFGFVFQKSLYLREIIKGGRTITGEHLVEQIPPIPITTLDLVQDIRFSIGRALDAMLMFREGDKALGTEVFSKSCFYGLRGLEILELKTFPLGYDEIYDLSVKVVTDSEYTEAIEAARAVRNEGKTPTIDMFFKNIALLDTYIEPKILATFNAQGDKQII